VKPGPPLSGQFPAKVLPELNVGTQEDSNVANTCMAMEQKWEHLRRGEDQEKDQKSCRSSVTTIFEEEGLEVLGTPSCEFQHEVLCAKSYAFDFGVPLSAQEFPMCRSDQERWLAEGMLMDLQTRATANSARGKPIRIPSLQESIDFPLTQKLKKRLFFRRLSQEINGVSQ